MEEARRQDPADGQDSCESRQRSGGVERVTVEADGGATGPIVLPAGDEAGKRKRTHRRLRWDNFTYTTRVTAAFAFVAAMTALVAIGVLSFVWEQHFQTYTQENMKSLAESTARNIEEIYDETGTLDDPRVIAAAEYAATMNSGIGVSIRQNGGGFIWDSTQVGESGSDWRSDAGRLSLAPQPSSNSQFAYANIEHDDRAVGSVNVWVLGSQTLLRSADEEFRDNSYQAMVFATVLAIVLASCIGFLFARALVSPINRMTRTAKAIKEGDLSARTELHGEDEIARLGETFDAMADSIERDRELERRLTTDVEQFSDGLLMGFTQLFTGVLTILVTLSCARRSWRYSPPWRLWWTECSRPTRSGWKR